MPPTIITGALFPVARPSAVPEHSLIRFCRDRPYRPVLMTAAPVFLCAPPEGGILLANGEPIDFPAVIAVGMVLRWVPGEEA